MILRKAKPEDMSRIIELLQSRGISPDFENTLANAVVEIDGKIIGFASLKINVEAVIALDKEANIRDLGQATKNLLERGLQVTKENNFDMMHVFVLDEKFENILKKHFSFNDCKGKYLYRKVD